MAKRRKRVDLTALRRESTQADGFGGEVLTSTGGMLRSQKPRRIESLPLSLIIPDRFQPRPLVPSWIRARFFAREINCYEAAQEWLEAAGQDAGVQERVNTLLSMGQSFVSHGQIKPITGAWREHNDQNLFVIETGERRYWAACLEAVKSGFEEEPTLQVVAVEAPARERQIIENQHAEPPSAVGRAREIAALLLDAAGVYPDLELTDDYDYFRSALKMRHKMTTWEHAEQIMGVSRPYMSRLLKVLNLPTFLLEMADTYQVPERVLREILDLPERQREDTLQKAIRDGLTHADIQQLRAADEEKARSPRGAPRRSVDPARKAARRLRTMFSALENDFPYEDAVGALASFLVAEMKDREALLQAADVLAELAEQVRIRVEG